MIRISWVSPTTDEPQSIEVDEAMAQEWWNAACQPVRETVVIEEIK